MQVSRVNLILVYGYTVPNLERMFLEFLENEKQTRRNHTIMLGEYSVFAGMVNPHQTARC